MIFIESNFYTTYCQCDFVSKLNILGTGVYLDLNPLRASKCSMALSRRRSNNFCEMRVWPSHAQSRRCNVSMATKTGPRRLQRGEPNNVPLGEGSYFRVSWEPRIATKDLGMSD